MRLNTDYALLPLFLVIVGMGLPTGGALAQNRLDVGLHFSPHLRYVTSTPVTPTVGVAETYGGSGLAAGFGFGGNLEYRITGDLYGRVGVDYFHYRQEYSVEYVEAGEPLPSITGTSRVTYNAIEIPVALLYRFVFPSEETSFLVGVGVVVKNWTGDPRVESEFSTLDRTGFESLRAAPYSASIFVGYDRFITGRVVMGLEPYFKYAPTRIRLESNTEAKVVGEVGLRLRLTLDN